MILVCLLTAISTISFYGTIVSLLQKCYSAIGMNFTQPLGTQHANKIYSNSVFKFSKHFYFHLTIIAVKRFQKQIT